MDCHCYKVAGDMFWLRNYSENEGLIIISNDCALVRAYRASRRSETSSECPGIAILNLFRRSSCTASIPSSPRSEVL